MTAPAAERLVSIDDIRAAARTLAGVALRTPLVALGPQPPRRLLKAESLQPIGAFKIRGAYVAVAGLSAEARARGVITYSSGNHAQGVARAARLLGAPAVVVMPSDAPAIKRERVAADGAEIVIVGPASEERRLVAERLAGERGLSIIPPYDDDRIIAGQGTCGLEIVEDVPDVAAILVPIGGGGLASGVAVAVRAIRPGCRVIGVEPELAADARDSLAAGRIVEWPRRARRAGRSPTGPGPSRSGGGRSPTCAALLDRIVTVTEARDRRRGPDRRRRGAARRRAVGRPDRRRAPVPIGRSRPRRRDGPGRGGRQRRQRRSRSLPRAAGRFAG